jgi:hypothetical protein
MDRPHATSPRARIAGIGSNIFGGMTDKGSKGRYGSMKYPEFIILLVFSRALSALGIHPEKAEIIEGSRKFPCWRARAHGSFKGNGRCRFPQGIPIYSPGGAGKGEFGMFVADNLFNPLFLIGFMNLPVVPPAD